MNRDKMCEFTSNNFRSLSHDDQLKLAKFIHIFDSKYIKAYQDGVRVVLRELPDVLITHIYNFVKNNIWK